ncbi:MAG: class II fructose-bisphosphate aldolase [bacterium]|nr:class II fructose-bisphosphate aldolase [bacterium]
MRDFIQRAILKGKAKEALPKVRKKALKQGIFLASIAPLYKEITKSNITDFSVPAFNIRALTFDTACAIFKSAKKAKAGAFILEIASSEMEYTKQNSEEFSLCILGAAIKEKYKGPIFLQGDHFYLKDITEEAINNLQDLILKSFNAGFYNFDIDCSALSLEDNIKQTNNFIDFIKKNQPQGVEVAIGGEVSSIGGAETTSAELDSFLKKCQGLTKVSCQTGTRHGGKILTSGDFAPINIDYENIKKLVWVAKQYGISGIVQHGASTLQKAQFTELKKAGVLEIHLSTLFSDIIFDSRYLPSSLNKNMHSWVDQNFAEEKENFWSNIQFFKNFRKKTLGIFKKNLWQMPEKNIKLIGKELEENFLFFFKVFGVDNTKSLVDKIYT